MSHIVPLRTSNSSVANVLHEARSIASNVQGESEQKAPRKPSGKRQPHPPQEPNPIPKPNHTAHQNIGNLYKGRPNHLASIHPNRKEQSPEPSKLGQSPEAIIKVAHIPSSQHASLKIVKSTPKQTSDEENGEASEPHATPSTIPGTLRKGRLGMLPTKTNHKGLNIHGATLDSKDSHQPHTSLSLHPTTHSETNGRASGMKKGVSETHRSQHVENKKADLNTRNHEISKRHNQIGTEDPNRNKPAFVGDQNSISFDINPYSYDISEYLLPPPESDMTRMYTYCM
eukprot:TRINITY_DN5388_c0_g2_i1.p1 TRINITY_DN5388_c0_g2~~TRINITY_DN5388_c0_g2_i1.p1  ORF type:complete len:285 (+),score=56.50 TRINITY_DN5388_c0_g2_i1:198-1052(+)